VWLLKAQVPWAIREVWSLEEQGPSAIGEVWWLKEHVPLGDSGGVVAEGAGALGDSEGVAAEGAGALGDSEGCGCRRSTCPSAIEEVWLRKEQEPSAIREGLRARRRLAAKPRRDLFSEIDRERRPDWTGQEWKPVRDEARAWCSGPIPSHAEGFHHGSNIQTTYSSAVPGAPDGAAEVCGRRRWLRKRG
jgi:hypothetical protein